MLAILLNEPDFWTTIFFKLDNTYNVKKSGFYTLKNSIIRYP